MFGKDAETIRWMNEMAESNNKLQQKLTTIWGITQNIENNLYTTNQLLKDIKEELSQSNIFPISSNLTQKLHAKNRKDKRLKQSEPRVYLDEILEEILETNINYIKSELERLK